MNRFALGGFTALVLAGLGLFWWQGKAAVEAGAPVTATVLPTAPPPLPQVAVGDMTGPAPPEATELSREQRRFGATTWTTMAASRATRSWRHALTRFASWTEMGTTY